MHGAPQSGSLGAWIFVVRLLRQRPMACAFFPFSSAGGTVRLMDVESADSGTKSLPHLAKAGKIGVERTRSGQRLNRLQFIVFGHSGGQTAAADAGLEHCARCR
jgi:hypothetical protein